MKKSSLSARKKEQMLAKPSHLHQEKSAGAVVFRLVRGVPHYLLLHYPSTKRGAESDYWDFPKGHIEGREKEQETARREIKEETGLEDIEFLGRFKDTIHYTFSFRNKRISKTVVFFLAKTNTKRVTISFEHYGFKWLPFEQAIEQVKFDNARRILQKAHQFLSSDKKRPPRV